MSDKDEARRLGIAIRKKCLDCSGGMVSEVRACRVKDCPLWAYRSADQGRSAPAKCRGQMDIFSLELGVRS